MQAILGAGGAIGNELAKNLTAYTDNIRIVSRSPEPVNKTDEIFTADLTDKKQVMEAVKGSKMAYLIAGLKYDIMVWEKSGLHSYTYTPDAGKATAILGNSNKAENQVWYLPTEIDPMNGIEWVEAFVKGFSRKPEYMILRK